MDNYSVDELYNKLGITSNEKKEVRNNINTGKMYQQIETNYSMGLGKFPNDMLSNGIQMKNKH
jgi:hypothetical protein|nr:MAG TPA_asm: hypothetical protein [Caudoviricetes sp.]